MEKALSRDISDRDGCTNALAVIGLLSICARNSGVCVKCAVDNKKGKGEIKILGYYVDNHYTSVDVASSIRGKTDRQTD